MKVTPAVLAAVLLPYASEAFAPVPGRATISNCHVGSIDNKYQWHLGASASDNDSSDETQTKSLRSTLKRKSKPISFAIVTAASFISCLPGQLSRQSLFRPAAAQASAPIVLRAAKPKDDPPMVQAMKKAAELKKQRAMEDFDAFMVKCNDIEDAEGKKARDAYEKQYETEKAAKAAQKAIDLENLKRDLLDEGKDPNTDLDAEREVFKFEHDVDLEKIPGTPHNEQMIKNFRSRGKNAPTYASQRYIVKCQVEDLKARGVDPLAHFSQPEVIDKTRAIYKMDNKVAEKVANQYAELMEQYGGRLTPAQEGETPFVRGEQSLEQSAALAKEKLAADKAAAKEKKAQEKAAAKAKRAAEKEAAKKEKEAQKQARAEEKAKAKAERDTMKASNEAAKAAVAAATGAAHMAADSEIAATAGMDFSATAGQEAGSHSMVAESTASSAGVSKSQEIMSTIKEYATVKNVGTVVVVGGVVNYGINYYRDNNSAAVKERERQLRLIMGTSDDDEDDEDDDFGNDLDDDDEEDLNMSSAVKEATETSPPPAPKLEPEKPKPEPPKAKKPAPAPVPEPVKPKKKFGFFSKKNTNDRETDLNVLIGPNADAPEFALLLSKIMTFGAPGRFPAIDAMGDMPFDKFDLDKAKEMLTELRSDLDLSDEKSAEIFASVVNCMIIDIVDLASATLKAKDKNEKLTVDALNVVMEFCDHAASLFDAVAKDVEIKPVTYGGILKKKELEQMFSMYAGSSMMSLIGGGASQDRVDTLQMVFGITDKKAEGLMQKHMMKVMMNMMKDGGKGMEGMPGMEGMEDMMKMMGGGEGMESMEEMMKMMGGMDGMPGMDGEMSPEDLKQTVKMMKDLMDSGQVSQEELTEIRNQFKQMYGSDIGELIKQADKEGGASMGAEEKELLDMFKRILGE